MDAHALQSDNHDSWLRRNRWRIGMVVVAVVGGLWWRRTGRENRISVGSVSERWLAEQAFEAGQRTEE
jgi:hypothetical protein